jgi:hypothetical protein
MRACHIILVKSLIPGSRYKKQRKCCWRDGGGAVKGFSAPNLTVKYLSNSGVSY